MTRPQWIPTLLLAIDRHWNCNGSSVCEDNINAMKDWILSQPYYLRKCKYLLAAIVRVESVIEDGTAHLHILRLNSDNPLITLRITEK